MNGVAVGSADGGDQDGHSDDIVFTDGRVFNQVLTTERKSAGAIKCSLRECSKNIYHGHSDAFRLSV